jgi:reactive intermediate/imine deaminase
MHQLEDVMRLISLLLAAICFSTVSTFNAEAQQSKKPGASKNRASKAQSKPQPQVEYMAAKISRPVPFSEAVRVGDTLYLSGQIGADESFKLVPGGIKAETKQVMENIKRVLERNGSSLDHVVKCTVMLADMSEWGAMNEVYVTYFSKDRLPARSALGANGLALGARVEIECIAVAAARP